MNEQIAEQQRRLEEAARQHVVNMVNLRNRHLSEERQMAQELNDLDMIKTEKERELYNY